MQRPNVVPCAPFHLNQPNAGGKVINAAAFTTPVPTTAQGDLGRNALRGFGATQWDITLRRQFRFTERFSLQFRSDFFNILNHPNFGSPINYLSSPQFGQFYADAEQLPRFRRPKRRLESAVSDWRSPLYQLALKLQF